MPSLKRKLSLHSSDSDDAPDLDADTPDHHYPTPPPTSASHAPSFSSPHKRRRRNSIERGLAGLRLDGASAPGSFTRTSSTASAFSSAASSPLVHSQLLVEPWAAAPDADMDADGAPYAFPQPIIEEPESPDPPPKAGLHDLANAAATTDVKMKGTSWYEPEKDRIVITDLDEAAQEAEDEYKPEVEGHPYASQYAHSNADMTVSAALLAHIRRSANFPYKTEPALAAQDAAAASMALVLFKPLPIPASATIADADDTQREQSHSRGAHTTQDGIDSNANVTPVVTFPNPIPEDDAMDVEL